MIPYGPQTVVSPIASTGRGDSRANKTRSSAPLWKSGAYWGTRGDFRERRLLLSHAAPRSRCEPDPQLGHFALTGGSDALLALGMTAPWRTLSDAYGLMA